MAASRCTRGARSKRRRRHPFGGVAAVSFMAYVLCVMAYVLGVMGYALCIRGTPPPPPPPHPRVGGRSVRLRSPHLHRAAAARGIVKVSGGFPAVAEEVADGYARAG